MFEHEKLEREREIAKKVQEVHGEHSWKPGDWYAVKNIITGVSIFYTRHVVPTAECGGEIPTWKPPSGFEVIWLPTPLQYMEMLWEISDLYVLVEDGVVAKMKWKFDSPIPDHHDFSLSKFAGSAAEAWYKENLSDEET